jgi:DNA mismatch repair ATPase MutL
MHRRRLHITVTCLLALTACTDDTQSEAGDEVETESESTESESTESESTESESTESESTDTQDTSSSSDTTEESTTEESTTEESTTEDPTTEESTEESTTDGPTTDTGVESCQEIESTYVSLVESNTGCDADAQCHVVDGHCGNGLGGCWYVVNDNLQQADLDELFDAFQGMACPPLVICACLPPPAVFACVDGTCQPL